MDQLHGSSAVARIKWLERRIDDDFQIAYTRCTSRCGIRVGIRLRPCSGIRVRPTDNGNSFFPTSPDSEFPRASSSC